MENRKPWFVDIADDRLDKFNRTEVQKRKAWLWKEIYDEWEESFLKLVSKIKKLSRKDWGKATKFRWSDGTLLTLISLFEYEYEGAGHEGGHAKQIGKFIT